MPWPSSHAYRRDSVPPLPVGSGPPIQCAAASESPCRRRGREGREGAACRGGLRPWHRRRRTWRRQWHRAGTGRRPGRGAHAQAGVRKGGKSACVQDRTTFALPPWPSSRRLVPMLGWLLGGEGARRGGSASVGVASPQARQPSAAWGVPPSGKGVGGFLPRRSRRVCASAAAAGAAPSPRGRAAHHHPGGTAAPPRNGGPRRPRSARTAVGLRGHWPEWRLTGPPTPVRRARRPAPPTRRPLPPRGSGGGDQRDQRNPSRHKRQNRAGGLEDHDRAAAQARGPAPFAVGRGRRHIRGRPSGGCLGKGKVPAAKWWRALRGGGKRRLARRARHGQRRRSQPTSRVCVAAAVTPTDAGGVVGGGPAASPPRARHTVVSTREGYAGDRHGSGGPPFHGYCGRAKRG